MEVAHAISRAKKSSKLKRFYLRVLAKSGKKAATVALARKVLCILYHLLVKREDYQEPEVKRTKPKITNCISPISAMNIDEMIKIISQAGYLVEKDLRDGCG